MNKKEIVSFDIAKINRGKQKVCACKSPHCKETINPIEITQYIRTGVLEQ